MQVIILAAGLSTRMRPLTASTPKPMLPVLGRPFLEHIVRHVASAGFDDIIITTHYCPETIHEHFGNGKPFGVRISYAHEEQLMNTAGSLKLLEHALQDDFMVIGGNDLLPLIDLSAFVRYHRSRGGIGTIAFKRLDDDALLPLFGQAELDADDRLLRFVEKPAERVSRLIHTTYQIYSRRVLAYVPAGLPCSIPEFMIQQVLAAGEHIYGYRTESPFVCISTWQQYEQASTTLSEIWQHREE